MQKKKKIGFFRQKRGRKGIPSIMEQPKKIASRQIGSGRSAFRALFRRQFAAGWFVFDPEMP
jgi:hypothetical protein